MSCVLETMPINGTNVHENVRLKIFLTDSEFYNQGFYLSDHVTLVNDDVICKKYKSLA